MSRSRLVMALLLSTAVVGFTPALAAAQDEASSSIEGPVWDLIVADDTLADVPASMSLEGGTASVFGGCNTFFGAYTLDGDSLTFASDFGGTLVECEPNVMEVEEGFIAGLGATASYQLDGGLLALIDESGAQVLSFDETGVATTADLAVLGFEIAKSQAHVQQLRRHVANIDVRGDVKALAAHVNELTKQHINQRDNQQQLRKRIHALETLVASMADVLAEEGIILE
jgi:heat shock protein HslJ